MITDELRIWSARRLAGWKMAREEHDEVAAIADRIDAEHESACAEAYGNGVQSVALPDMTAYVKLPVDADGVTIHAGDVLDGYGKTIEVVELRYGRSGWVLISRDGNGYADHFAFTHHHEPTVEDVLREMHAELDDVTALYVSEAIDSDERDRDEARIFAEYAKRLTLVGDAE